MTELFTLALPRLDGDAADRIEALRRRHDPQAGRIGAHVTLAFGCAGVAEAAYLAHVGAIAEATEAFAFTAARIVPGPDHFGSGGYVFLLPEIGAEALAGLHDRLYTGPLAPHLRSDIPYLPHLTLGYCATPDRAEALARDIGRDFAPVSGRVDALTVVAREGERITPRAQLPLG